MQVILGARHGDVKQPPFLLDLSGRPGSKVRGQAAIDHVEHENRFPFLAFGGMDRGKDQIVFIEQRHSSLIAGGIRWVKRQLSKKPFPGGIAGSDLL